MFKKALFHTSLIASLFFLEACKDQQESDHPLDIRNLQCEFMSNPKGVEHKHPYLSWEIDAPGKRNVFQSSYRILVYESEGRPKDDSSLFRPRLTLEYAKANDGTTSINTAILINKFDIGFPRARVRFVMSKGTSYTVSNGTIEQAFDGDSVHVIDVCIALDSNSTTEIDISSLDVLYKK